MKTNQLLLALVLVLLAGMVKAQHTGKNFIVIEAENTASDLGLWKIITPTDTSYFHPEGSIAPINNTYIEFMGNDHNGGDPKSPLEYTFKCPKSGTYRMVMRMHQRLLGLAEDKCNDVWVKMSGDFTSASPGYSTDDLRNNMKCYGRGTETWGVCHKGEGGDHHQKEDILYRLKKGETYTFTMSGRAQRTGIDYILFYDISLPLHVKSFEDLAKNDTKYQPQAYQKVIKVNAIDFDSYSKIDGFKDATVDKKKGMDILSIKERMATGAAQYQYKGKHANVVFKLNTMQEIDGESEYVVKVNDQIIGKVINDRIYGTSLSDYTTQNHVISGLPVEINNGDVIQVEFTNTTNGLVPEGDLTATSRARWISLEICVMP